MRPEELRIGNCVKYARGVLKHEGKITTIGAIIVGETDFYEPIPLTEEWLVKFGFECNFNNPNKWLQIAENGEELEIYSDWLGEQCLYDRVSIKYVHQLQNLYFALTGNELTIKE